MGFQGCGFQVLGFSLWPSKNRHRLLKSGVADGDHVRSPKSQRLRERFLAFHLVSLMGSGNWNRLWKKWGSEDPKCSDQGNSGK